LDNETAVFFILGRMEITAVLYFLRNGVKLHFYSLGTIFEGNMRVSRGMQSLGSWFPIGARSISVGTRFCLQSIPATCSIEEWVEQREEMDEGLNAFIALTHKYVDVEELTQTIVNEYIKKIIAFAPDKSSGKRTQKVKIYFNFVDDVEIPVISETITTENNLWTQKNGVTFGSHRSLRQIVTCHY
jgi:hypothetical protein